MSGLNRGFQLIGEQFLFMQSARKAGDAAACAAADAVCITWFDETFDLPGTVTADIKTIINEATVDLAKLVTLAESSSVQADLSAAKVDVSTLAEVFGDPWAGSRHAQEALFAAYPQYVPKTTTTITTATKAVPATPAATTTDTTDDTITDDSTVADPTTDTFGPDTSMTG